MTAKLLRMPTVAPASFDNFWKVYPRPVGKLLAADKFRRITGDGLRTFIVDHESNYRVEVFLKATPEEILAAARKFSATLREGGLSYGRLMVELQHIPLPSTWLNQGRWLD